MFEALFERKKLNTEKALRFGFGADEDGLRYETDIMRGQFRLRVCISSMGEVDTDVVEQETGEAYTLYRTNAPGAFVGEVRLDVETVLANIADECFDVEVFKTPQARALIRYVSEKYGDDLKFLWKKFPDNAVWRRRDNSRWYAAVLTVAKNKLGLDSAETVEIIDLRIQPEKMEELLKNDHFYPGWHMNKKSWYTIILDGSVDTREICERIDESYRLALD